MSLPLLDTYRAELFLHTAYRFTVAPAVDVRFVTDCLSVYATAPVDEVLLKAIDAPEKKSPLVKCLRKDDRRHY